MYLRDFLPNTSLRSKLTNVWMAPRGRGAQHIGRKVIWWPGEDQHHQYGQVYREMAIGIPVAGT